MDNFGDDLVDLYGQFGGPFSGKLKSSLVRLQCTLDNLMDNMVDNYENINPQLGLEPKIPQNPLFSPKTNGL